MWGDNYQDTLVMKTLGVFSLRYNDISLISESRKTESQFSHLLQLLIHNLDKGVTKEELEYLLFQQREVNNSSHNLQSVIYNSKQRLRKLGLPQVDYIYQKDGIYYWNKEIPTVEDCRVFEELVRKGKAESNLAKKIAYISEATFIYRGDYLQNQNNVVLYAEEGRKYKNLFRECVNIQADFFRKNKRFPALEMLGKYAAQVSPFEEWEELIMEAYVSSGKYEEARKLYFDTSELYIQSQDALPSKTIGMLLNEMSRQIEFPERMLSEVEGELQKEIRGDEGAFEVTYPTFSGIYRSIYHIMERKNEPVYLMMCTIVNSKGTMMRDTPKLRELSQRLDEAIKSSIRRGDIVNKLGKSQYLLLLANTTLENCMKIQKRIDDKFIINRQRIKVEYSVVNIFDYKERG